MIKIKYKVGQILTNDKDMEMEKDLNGRKPIIPKGSKFIVGADKLGHHIEWWKWLSYPFLSSDSYDRYTQPILLSTIYPCEHEIEIEGYDARGLAEYLYRYLGHIFPIREIFEEYDVTEEELISSIASTLDEIGF